MKPLSECTNDELNMVFKTNSKLMDQVEEDLVESEMFHISEIMDEFREFLLNYEIGFYNRNFINVKDPYNFIRGVMSANRMYGFLDDEESLEIKTLFDVMENEEDDDKRDILEKELSDLTETYTQNQLILLTDYENIDNYKQEYFKEFYMENRMDGNFFVDDDYTLFEHVDFMKSYK